MNSLDWYEVTKAKKMVKALPGSVIVATATLDASLCGVGGKCPPMR